jgi:hypothetical protein
MGDGLRGPVTCLTQKMACAEDVADADGLTGSYRAIDRNRGHEQ